MKKFLSTVLLLVTSATAQAIMPIVSPNETCMWPWTRPDITVGSKWEAVHCTGGKNPYKNSCETETYHILDIKNGYAKYNLTYINSAGEKVTAERSGSVKFISCTYTSFKKISSQPKLL